MEKNEALNAILEEYKSASKKFGSFSSEHEGYAVLLEEVDELWDEIKKKNGSFQDMKNEAIQVGAMALRFLVDLC